MMKCDRCKGRHGLPVARSLYVPGHGQLCTGCYAEVTGRTKCIICGRESEPCGWPPCRICNSKACFVLSFKDNPDRTAFAFEFEGLRAEE